MTEKQIKIGGMTCAMCVKAVEKSIIKLQGIENLNINLASEKAIIKFDETKTDINRIKSAVIDAGYEFLDASDTENALRIKDANDKLYRALIGLIISIAMMILMYGSHILHDLPKITLPLFTFLVLSYTSYPIFKKAFAALKNLTLTMEVMYSLGIGVSYIASVMGTFNVVFTHEFMFYDSAIMLASFLMIGKYLEAKAKSRTSETINKLSELKPEFALVIKDSAEIKVPVSNLMKGNVLKIKAGDRIPVDGYVIEGKSYVDESALTGEPYPILKEANSYVNSGTINTDGLLLIRAEKVGNDTILSKIIEYVEAAQFGKAPYQKIADRAVKWFIPIVFSIAILAFILWYFIFSETLLFAFTAFVSILVIACPCALGLATPTAVTVGIGKGAENGILFKDSEVIEKLVEAKTIVFDKTGTLTLGKPTVDKLYVFKSDHNSILEIASSMEKNSNHPLGKAIIEQAKEHEQSGNIKFDEFKDEAGKGISALAENNRYLLGSAAFIEQNSINLSDEQIELLENLNMEAKTCVFIACNNEVLGIFSISDVLKNDSEAVIRTLNAMSYKTVLITGDSQKTAKSISEKLGIKEYYAEVLPTDKGEIIKKIQQNGTKTIFIGDGINDAPALSQSDVGISVANGTDIAIESGNLVLMKNKLTDILNSIELSKKIVSRIKLNLFWAFAYNFALIPAAAGVLTKPFGIVFSPEIAGLAMAMSSLTVVSLSLLLKRIKLKY